MKNYDVKYAIKEFNKFPTPKVINKRLAYLVPNMFGKMKSGFAKKINPIILAYEEELKLQVIEQVSPIQVEAPIVEPEPINEPIVEKVEEVVINNEKKFIIKASLKDFELLSKNQIITSSAPKKLLIPTKFKSSLFTNYIKNKEIAVEPDPALIESKSPAQIQQTAVLEYIALNNEMKNLIKDIEQIKAKMINLAKEHGLTRSMVENAMQN